MTTRGARVADVFLNWDNYATEENDVTQSQEPSIAAGLSASQISALLSSMG